ncbi:MAG: PD-(D/E)XK nuclease family protein, partial [Patescibacteria group bacterium]
QAGEEGALSTDDQASPDEVQVMTMHGAKGLEFRFVFLVNLVDRRFPSARRGDPIPLPEGLMEGNADLDHLAEERRLCYVGLTRARERVFLTSADSYGGARKKKPSLFLSELGFDAPAALLPSTEPSYLSQRAVDHVVGLTAPITTPAQFSFTQLTAYDHCPLQYKYAHVYKIPVFGSGSQSFGKTTHATLQRFFEEWMMASPVSLDRLLELYRASWIDEWYGTPERKEAYRAQGEEMLRAYHATLDPHPPRPLFLERGFTVKVGDMVIKGRVDRIDRCDDGVEIIDYKTGTPKTQKTLTAIDRMQMLLYALAAREVFMLEPKQLTFLYLMDGSRVSFEPKEKDLERLREQLRKTIGAIREQKFDQKPGPACRQCDFRSICPFRAR